MRKPCRKKTVCQYENTKKLEHLIKKCTKKTAIVKLINYKEMGFHPACLDGLRTAMDREASK